MGPYDANAFPAKTVLETTADKALIQPSDFNRPVLRKAIKEMIDTAPANIREVLHPFPDDKPDASLPLEYTGKSVSYYKVQIKQPTTEGNPAYIAECNDIIEALGMNYAEGNAFKAIWRSCAARTLGKMKKGYSDAMYDAEKIIFFGERMLVQAKELKDGKNNSNSSE